VALAAAFTLFLSSAYYHLDAAGPQSSTPGQTTNEQTATAAAPLRSAASPNQALLNRYCLSCHSDRLRTGGLSLAGLNPDNPVESAATWEKVIRKLRSGAMPPPGLPKPDGAAVAGLLTWLTTELDEEAERNPNPGRTAVHRLNRTEYQNAVRDLLALDVDARALLPADDQAHGFDNLAAVLSVSPTLLERYQSAARKISQLAVGDPGIRPVFETVNVDERLIQDDRTSDDQPFGSRGGVVVQHYFPLDGEYTVRVALRRTLYGYIRGLGLPHKMDIRVDGERVALLTVGGEHDPATGIRPPETNSGNYIGDPFWEDYSHTADEKLEARFTVKAGAHLVGVSFDKGLALPDGILDRPLDVATFRYASDEMQTGNPAVASLTVGGPFNGTTPTDSPSRRAIFSCLPDASADAVTQAKCARQIFGRLAKLAYRRPVNQDDVETLMGFYTQGGELDPSRRFEAGIQYGLERMLMDPEFIFRIQQGTPGPTAAATSAAPANVRLTGLELASRLSFFLWSSIPDEELLDVAASGRLSDPAVLEGQVTRMLADPRAEALPVNFGGQWLELRLLRAQRPDAAIFPEFDENLREAMRLETEMFLTSQMRENRSIVDLLRADYTFLNERLARHYGINDVYGVHHRRVQLADQRRHGLLGQASLMTVTSYPNRTSPVLRGKWLLEKFLGAPPPDPPPDVPALPDRGEGGAVVSVRARLEQHRNNPVCASCHRTIDPMGFALENFDAVGKWRTIDDGGVPNGQGHPIDSSGVMPDGMAFDGVSQLREALVTHRRMEFVGTVVEQMLTYALGRGLEYYDMPTVRAIVKHAETENYSWTSVIQAIVRSTPYQSRRAS